MTISQQIAQHLFDVHEGDNWTDVNIKNTLNNVLCPQAIAITAASKNSIAALLYHICFYTNIVHQRLRGIDPFINDKNGFDHPEIRNEADWQGIINQCFQAASSLEESLQNYPDDKLFMPLFENRPTAYKAMHGLIEHTHYHLGQIVLIKHLVQQ